MRVLITGADGFIGKNLRLRLGERKDLEVLCFTKKDPIEELPKLVKDVDFIFHLAGVNRPQNLNEFKSGNVDLCQKLADAISQEVQLTGRRSTVVLASSTQAKINNPYGHSKLQAEKIMLDLAATALSTVHIFRLPNVFGKWCLPNYNSVVATFCHNIARDLPVQINDPHALLNLIYIDDVINHFIQIIDQKISMSVDSCFVDVQPIFQITVAQLEKSLREFHESRQTLILQGVGSGLQRALYATYVSYLPQEAFSYPLPQYKDARGTFVEMIKTAESGQVSYFTAFPGVTRGGHYHHSKTEKFLVIKGRARFGFRHMENGEVVSLHTTSENPQIVETVPGWTHDITNIGTDEMLVLVWTNEIFNRDLPDTYPCPV